MPENPRREPPFRFIIDNRPHEWPAQFITGRELKKVAGVDPATHAVWLDQPGKQEDPKIGDDERVDLGRPGVERFFTGVLQTTEG